MDLVFCLFVVLKFGGVSVYSFSKKESFFNLFSICFCRGHKFVGNYIMSTHEYRENSATTNFYDSIVFLPVQWLCTFLFKISSSNGLRECDKALIVLSVFYIGCCDERNNRNRQVILW